MYFLGNCTNFKIKSLQIDIILFFIDINFIIDIDINFIFDCM